VWLYMGARVLLAARRQAEGGGQAAQGAAALAR
jgi:hypothetical protein